MISTVFRRLATFMALLADKFNRQRDAKQEFLAAQIEILRKRLKTDHVKLSPAERRQLLALGTRFDHQVDDFILVVKPGTYRGWLRDAAAGKEPKQVGRKRTCRSIADIVIRMARENLAWGYMRIVGEVKKLGIKISHAGVKNILMREGIHPTRGGGWRWKPARHWQEFVDSHMSSLLGCDFVSTKVFTWRGWVDAFVFVVVHLESRRAYISPATLNPNHFWLAQQIRNVSMWCEDEGFEVRYFIRDNDAKFGEAFDGAVEANGWEVVKTSLMAPDMNAFAEAFIATTRRECLDHFSLFGLSHLDNVLTAWRVHYNEDRPHQGRGIGNRVLGTTFVPQGEGEVACRTSLGGLLKSYSRRAA